jgi:hypothetical protein
MIYLTTGRENAGGDAAHFAYSDLQAATAPQ